MNEQYARAKQILSEHKEGHNRLAQLLIDKEVIFSDDVEQIFGPRPWASRSEEIITANETAKELKKVAEEESRKAEQAVKEVKEQAQGNRPALPTEPTGPKEKEEKKEGAS